MKEYVDLARWFSILYRRSQQFVVEAGEELGLTYSEYVLLLRLYDHEGAMQDELAASLFLDKAVVTRTVNSLEKKGYLTREADEMDRRIRHVYLTDFARAQYPFLCNILQRWTEYLCKGLKKSEVKVMFGIFGKLTDRACAADLAVIAQNIPKESEP